MCLGIVYTDRKFNTARIAPEVATRLVQVACCAIIGASPPYNYIVKTCHVIWYRAFKKLWAKGYNYPIQTICITCDLAMHT